MERWAFDPSWPYERALLEQLRWHRDGRRDDTRGPLAAWHSVRKLDGLRERYQTGDARAVLDALELCALDSLPMPPWLEVAFLKAYGALTCYAAKSWDDIFGPAHPKYTNILAAKQKMQISADVFMSAALRLYDDPSRPIDNGLYEEVASEFGIGKTLVQEYVAQHSKETGITLQYYKGLSTQPG